MEVWLEFVGVMERVDTDEASGDLKGINAARVTFDSCPCDACLYWEEEINGGGGLVPLSCQVSTCIPTKLQWSVWFVALSCVNDVDVIDLLVCLALAACLTALFNAWLNTLAETWPWQAPRAICGVNFWTTTCGIDEREDDVVVSTITKKWKINHQKYTQNIMANTNNWLTKCRVSWTVNCWPITTNVGIFGLSIAIGQRHGHWHQLFQTMMEILFHDDENKKKCCLCGLKESFQEL